MLPRNEEERRRHRNSAFVKFATYESAFLAKEYLRDKYLLGKGLKITWGKGVPQMLRLKGMLKDFQGRPENTDQEMEFVENQLNIWLKQ